MAKTKEFVPTGEEGEFGFQPGYRLNEPTVVLHTSLVERGTLMKFFRFNADKPEVSSFIKGGDEVYDRKTVPMNKYDVAELAQAYTALLQLGGSPFNLRDVTEPKERKPVPAPEMATFRKR